MAANENEYVLLKSFRGLFEGCQYLHRDSSLGDYVASCLYDDLYNLKRSQTLVRRIRERLAVVNAQNKTIGKPRRRGDGTFGEVVPAAHPVEEPGFLVARGAIATIEIGAETKILAKAMIKQIDRVIGDLVRQVQEFKRGGGTPITVGLVGVNFSESYTSYEGDRPFPTDGRKYKHPIQEAAEAVNRLRDRALPAFDEFMFLRFKATNIEPFPFDWLEENKTVMEYSAMLTRICIQYENRFSA
ncbi:MAG TPA: hypothetical protein VFQ00_09055 [Terriglobales bacterium]|nr:hypothetical protein [Terriglobales bacterium]